jgi:nitric oxide synthase-interacting protein
VQRQQIKRFEKDMDRARRDEEEMEEMEDEQARDRAVRDFEWVQMGLSLSQPGTLRDVVGRENGKVVIEQVENRGEKRKFELDEDELIRIAKQDRDNAKRALTEEKACDPRILTLANSSWPHQKQALQISGSLR